ncbi:MAG: hypothetical protein ABIO17_01310 [Pseudoxanthomonas sp.]
MLTADAVHRRACRVLPEVLATSGVLLEDQSQYGLAALLFPLRRKSSGSLAFHLSAQTLDALQCDPMRVLHTAQQARHGLCRHATPLRYRPWRTVRVAETTLPVYVTSSENGSASIVLIPSERMAIYFWNDHAMPDATTSR